MLCQMLKITLKYVAPSNCMCNTDLESNNVAYCYKCFCSQLLKKKKKEIQNFFRKALRYKTNLDNSPNAVKDQRLVRAGFSPVIDLVSYLLCCNFLEADTLYPSIQADSRLEIDNYF